MLNDKSLKDSLKAGALLPVYIIAGDDTYLKSQALERIIKATVQPDDDLNLVKYNHSVNLQEVYDELNGFPVMADKKCVVLSEFDFDEATTAEFENLCEIISEPYDTSVFILYFGNTDVDFKKSERWRKLVSFAEKAGGALVHLDHKTREELIRWLCASAKKKGAELSSRVASYMIELCSVDINILSNELNKLCFFVKSGEITTETVDRICVKSVEASVFDLSNKIITGDSSGAMKLLDELYFMNTETSIIFYEIAFAFVNLKRAQAIKSAGKRPDDYGDKFNLGKRGFLLTRAAGNLRRFDDKNLNLCFDALISAEREIKSYSSSGRMVLEKLVVKLIYIMKTGEALD